MRAMEMVEMASEIQFSIENIFSMAISTISMARMVVKLNSFGRALKDLYFLFLIVEKAPLVTEISRF
jgi:hypothetical protein